ncbi:MAG: rhomboid family intramembrane serine protease [Planctomycetaceae bacterium]|nr:rhomboid family intramembrane serine protease [Planctomycetaceae bacterium]
MLVPINTDAPIYHFPAATIGLIVANVLCFAASGFGNPQLLPYWALEYGNGINPLEWLTASFAHSSFMHLLGNMFFLWGFGLVVEGKLGWRRFLKLYFSLVFIWGAGVDLLTVHRTDWYVANYVLPSWGFKDAEDLKQTLIDRAEQQGHELAPEDAEKETQEAITALKGRCVGASGVIFALMAMSLVWAPKNEMTMFLFICIRGFIFDITILWYSVFFFGLQLLTLFIDQFEMGTSGLHMVGIVIGLAAGTLYVKRDWVDCEKWDLFSVLSGEYGQFAKDDWQLGAFHRTENAYSEIPVPQFDGSPDLEGPGGQPGSASPTMQRILTLIDSGEFMAASDEMLTLRLTDSVSMLDQQRLRRFAIGLMQGNMIDESEGYLEEYIYRFPGDSAWARLRLAQILLKLRKRPRAAYETLQPLSQLEITPEQKDVARRIAAEARRQVESGVKDQDISW